MTTAHSQTWKERILAIFTKHTTRVRGDGRKNTSCGFFSFSPTYERSLPPEVQETRAQKNALDEKITQLATSLEGLLAMIESLPNQQDRLRVLNAFVDIQLKAVRRAAAEAITKQPELD